MTLTLGFSPCPNDCFMFDAIVHRRVDLEGLEFTAHLADVKALNKAAFAGEADVTKLRLCHPGQLAKRRPRLDLLSAADHLRRRLQLPGFQHLCPAHRPRQGDQDLHRLSRVPGQ